MKMGEGAKTMDFRRGRYQHWSQKGNQLEGTSCSDQCGLCAHVEAETRHRLGLRQQEQDRRRGSRALTRAFEVDKYELDDEGVVSCTQSGYLLESSSTVSQAT